MNTWYFLKPTNAAALAKIKTAIKKERPPPSTCSNSCSPEFVKVWHKFTPNSKVLFCLKSWPQIKSFQRMRAELIYSIITRPNWARKVRELFDFWGGWTDGGNLWGPHGPKNDIRRTTVCLSNCRNSLFCMVLRDISWYCMVWHQIIVHDPESIL